MGGLWTSRERARPSFALWARTIRLDPETRALRSAVGDPAEDPAALGEHLLRRAGAAFCGAAAGQVGSRAVAPTDMVRCAWLLCSAWRSICATGWPPRMTTDQTDVFASRAQGRVGTVLRGKYRLDGILGVGGMAVVYVGDAPQPEAQFAVKMLHPELSTREDIRARFLREGYAANSVEHPGAVAVLDDDVAEDGSAFLVMELLDGATVDEAAERRGRQAAPAARRCRSATQLLDVLAAAHAQGHRPPRHQAREPLPHARRRAQGARLRHRARARRRRQRPATGTGQRARDARVHGARAGDGEGRRGRRGRRTCGRRARRSSRCSAAASCTRARTRQQVMIAAATKPARSLRSVAPDVPGALAAVVDRALAFDKKDALAGRGGDARRARAGVRRVARRPREPAAADADLVELGEPASAALQSASTSTPLGQHCLPGTPPAVHPVTADKGAAGGVGGTLRWRARRAWSAGRRPSRWPRWPNRCRVREDGDAGCWWRRVSRPYSSSAGSP